MPVFTHFENDVPQGNDWAHGFMRGVSMRQSAWRELIEDEERGGCLIPMMALLHEHDPDPELRPPPIAPEKRMDFLAYMGAGLMLAYQHFKEQREAEVVRMAGSVLNRVESKRQPKVGRNEPCPCGSGKKYKRCCGNVTVQ